MAGRAGYIGATRRRELKDTQVKALKPAKSGERYETSDTEIGGLRIRVTDKGSKTFILYTRYPGSTAPARRALGEYGELTLAEARDKARAWKALLKRGIDPRGEEDRQKAAEQRKRANTFAAVAEDFIKEKLPGERKGKEVERDIRRDLIPALGSRPITDISPQDVLAVIRAVKARGPYQAHNVLGHAKRLFAWAIDQHAYGLETSPCDRLKPKAIIGAKKSRQRILSDDEIRAFWRATARVRYPYGPAARLLLLTGLRHEEVTDAKRSEFHPDLMALIRKHDENNGPINWQQVNADWKLWAIGAERFKSDAPHMVPLSSDACALLTDLPQFRKGEHLFSTTFGEKPTHISDKVKKAIDARMLLTQKAMARLRGDDPKQVELKPWVFHDLKRTVRSHMSALRVPDHVAEMVAGHGRKGLQRVYDQHRYLEEMREALELWAARLRSIVEPPPANVVELAKARGA
jgi:hypothetical protein